MRLGLTMRETGAEDYLEIRDAIARDWYNFLNSYLPGHRWLLLPTLPSTDVFNYIDGWGLDGFMLTGGPDIGVSPLRDTFEELLITYALSKSKPLIGICRGFQLLQQMLGGKLQACSPAEHRKAMHDIILEKHPEFETPDTPMMRVNSYHSRSISIEGLASPLKPLATCGDWVECAVSVELKIMGIMWHPERIGGNPQWVAALLNSFISRTASTATNSAITNKQETISNK
jgi:putative glutamine amidotransferase